jgi:hypothetical protein
MSMGFLVEENAAIVWRGLMAGFTSPIKGGSAHDFFFRVASG